MIVFQCILSTLDESAKETYSVDEKLLLSYEFCLKHSLHKKCPYSELFWSAFFPHFPSFGLNTKRYGVSLRIQSEYGKMPEKCGPE